VNALSRAGEVALGVIGTILNIILLIFVTLAVVGASNANTDELKQMFEEEIALSDPNMTPEDIAVFNDAVDVGIEVVGVVGWVVVVTLLISIILSILGVVKVSKNKSPKAAGIMFIFAGLLSGILLLAPILFYIAAIMCFVRKTPVQYVEDPYYNTEVQHQNQPQQPL
jgi:phosphoglycerol transferase MdoB-like AlkP superfamily enzyme